MKIQVRDPNDLIIKRSEFKTRSIFIIIKKIIKTYKDDFIYIYEKGDINTLIEILKLNYKINNLFLIKDMKIFKIPVQ